MRGVLFLKEVEIMVGVSKGGGRERVSLERGERVSLLFQKGVSVGQIFCGSSLTP